MNIFKKIEEVRQQPENVRVRWVWMCVAVSMALIFAIWIFSITMMFRKNNPAENTIDTAAIEEQFQDMKDQSASLKDYANQQLNIDSKNPESIGSLQNSSAGSSGDNSEIPQSGSYSDLQDTQQ